jgi:hypothetical protein
MPYSRPTNQASREQYGQYSWLFNGKTKKAWFNSYF